MLKWLFQIHIILLAVVIAGCSHQVNVQHTLVAEEHLLPAISSSGLVAVIDQSQKPLGETEFCDAFGRAYSTQYNDFSAYAMHSIADLLTRNNIHVDATAEKKLIISDLKAACETDGLLKFSMALTVTTGNGLKKSFRGHQRFFHLYERDFALSAATLNAALEMFKDDDILDYLKQK